MTVVYVVLGGILMAMGAVQMWLRHGPEGRKLRAEQEALLQRRMEHAKAAAADDPDAAPGAFDPSTKAWKRSNKAWTGWTAVLGGVGIAFGIVLVVLGLLGY